MSETLKGITVEIALESTISRYKRYAELCKIDDDMKTVEYWNSRVAELEQALKDISERGYWK